MLKSAQICATAITLFIAVALLFPMPRSPARHACLAPINVPGYRRGIIRAVVRAGAARREYDARRAIEPRVPVKFRRRGR